MSKSKSQTSSTKTVVTGEETFLLVPVEDITILPPPKKGEKQALFNARAAGGEDKYTPEALAPLRESIQIDGLHQPVIVRVRTEESRGKKSVISTELLGGHGRLFSIKQLREMNAWVYDDQQPKKSRYSKGATVICEGALATVAGTRKGKVSVKFNNSGEVQEVPANELLPTVPARKKYDKIPCRASYDITDVQAMRFSCSENSKRRELTAAEELQTCEYLLSEGFTKKQISELIGQKEYWINQTLGYRKLPAEALGELLSGKMSRNAANILLGYSAEDRSAVMQAAKEAEAKESEGKVATAESEQFAAEDNASIEEELAENAQKSGDETSAQRHQREADKQKRAAKTSKAKKQRAKKGQGTIAPRHLDQGAKDLGIDRRVKNMLTHAEMERLLADIEEKVEEEQVFDEKCGEKVERSVLELVGEVVRCVLNGDMDPVSPIRNLFVSHGKWEIGGKQTGDMDELQGPTDDALSHVDETYDYDTELSDPDEEAFRAENPYYL
jgi:ParB-like chromosome segregation protein Spo0J